ncbi:CAP domain-containing protein [Algoriphagus hitonicola]|uniref:Cysteine-rich secretory protein family protein n=1 Tax=Algoriphagus hitonicola TaxID=435880 RepID=A0A1I2RIT4_9BACT|nr:CAP domain-containing protein [Algoriphagus hitonicola]SFG40584.1 Cysteine-rich secretory protein family protein [Algoriphagus hitonicola]
MKQLILIFLMPFFIFQKALGQNWKSQNYQNLTWEDFFNQPQANQPIDYRDIDYGLLHAAIYYATNEQRSQHGLGPLKYSFRIEQLSASHASDMVNYNFYGHFSTIRNKRLLRDRFQIVGLNPGQIAENISSTAGLDYEYGRPVGAPQSPGDFYYRSSSQGEPVQRHTYASYAKEVVKLWMDSPGHRANILSPSFRYLGVGCAVYPEKKLFNMPYFINVQCFSNSIN